MISILKQYKIALTGILVGGILGYAYYHFIGCTTGTCAITSKPFNSTVYGMVMGYLMFSVFQKSKTKKEHV
ncbi:MULTISPECIES: DUF6132 family protein [Chryseobacterium]|uniref:Uncharacterized protein n=1 Tax=Chryseobacterium salivictor TaxID=2547600 RepID=A0A4P6ZEG1_9FLAO|nr:MULTISPECIES: DUF6132 family protein [Chryseobacterium]MDQ0476716.1 hypothetical protein [Chryseobacterium sp. MDT2-18]QBO57897.1 hypothetical protein NBC122_01068 [Chryseobacterium salivictor]